MVTRLRGLLQCPTLLSRSLYGTRGADTFKPSMIARSLSANGRPNQMNAKARCVPTNQSPVFVSSRCLSSDGAPHTGLVSPDLILRSPLPDITIPDMCVHEFVFQKCDEFSNSIAVEDFHTGESYTYAQVKENSLRLASALHRLGLRHGDVLLAFTPNTIHFPLVMLACSCLGVMFTAANPSFKPAELRHQLIDSGATAVFADQSLADTVTQAVDCPELTARQMHLFAFGSAPGFQPFADLLSSEDTSCPDVAVKPRDDVYTLPYSSGTTGLPKGVMLTHYNILANILQLNTSTNMEAGDPCMGLMPMFHIYGMVAIQYALFTRGCKLVTLQKFEPESFLQCMQNKKIVYCNVVPPLAIFLAKHPLVDKYDMSSLRQVTSGAAPLGSEVSEEFQKRLPHVVLNQGYGLTETSPATNFDTVGITGSVGPLLPNTLAKVLDLETGEALGPGQSGEYCIRGPQVMKGYLNNEKATKEMIDPEGWLRTGDVVRYTEDGVVFVEDRVKELIKYKGSQVAPAELEALLLSHPALSDVGVVGIPDELAGELPKAFVVKKANSSVTEEELIQFVEDQVTSVKCLRGGVQFVTEVPKTPSGKILRRILKEL
ncbi:4-coumarate--CoA ligase [Aplysia californica]|uniref:4-coumarate--CoA ligase n=1 Tax=Aplysia californica TaxID=6500 RepID=A0ABM1A7L3_APLCA|nr:4-coumarate--CoA ligase [Aplysia californica]